MAKPNSSQEFFQLKKEAQKFGVAQERPQDINKSLMKSILKKNLALTNGPKSLPEGYIDMVSGTHLHLQAPTPQLVDINEKPNKGKSIGPIDSISILNHAISDMKKNQVVAMDLEFHLEHSYDGYICLASVSTQASNYVLDGIGTTRRNVISEFGRILENKQILKVGCGMDNDILRLQKDWNCFMVNAVDIQDMFLVWKTANYEECFKHSTAAIQNHLRGKKKSYNDADIAEYFVKLSNPGLDFLTFVFYGKTAKKDRSATFADWRKRPLNDELFKYAVFDSFYTRKLFFLLYAQIGETGLTEALKMAVRKLTKANYLQKYPIRVKLTNDELTSRVLQWRAYLALHLDKNPARILRDQSITQFCNEIHAAGEPYNCQNLQIVLTIFQVDDDKVKSARLLEMYLDTESEKLERMKSIICRNCNKPGHTAKFCPEEDCAKDKQAYAKRPENAASKAKEDARRWDNFCKKRGLDPSTAIKPWAKKI